MSRESRATCSAYLPICVRHVLFEANNNNNNNNYDREVQIRHRITQVAPSETNLYFYTNDLHLAAQPLAIFSGPPCHPLPKSTDPSESSIPHQSLNSPISAPDRSALFVSTDTPSQTNFPPILEPQRELQAMSSIPITPLHSCPSQSSHSMR